MDICAHAQYYAHVQYGADIQWLPQTSSNLTSGTSKWRKYTFLVFIISLKIYRADVDRVYKCLKWRRRAPRRSAMWWHGSTKPSGIRCWNMSIQRTPHCRSMPCIEYQRGRSGSPTAPRWPWRSQQTWWEPRSWTDRGGWRGTSPARGEGMWDVDGSLPPPRPMLQGYERRERQLLCWNLQTHTPCGVLFICTVIARC